MRDGMYKAEYQTPFGTGAGIFVLKDGTLYGGNSGLYYYGTYEVEGDKLTGIFKTGRHTYDLSVASVFGQDDLSITVEGEITGHIITFDGQAKEVPDVQMRGTLTYIDVGE